jgi:hypothetical protein
MYGNRLSSWWIMITAGNVGQGEGLHVFGQDLTAVRVIDAGRIYVRVDYRRHSPRSGVNFA